MVATVTALERAARRVAPGWVVDAAPSTVGSLQGIERALRRYRLLAWTVGVGLLVLVVVGVPLQYGASSPGVVEVVGPIHGVVYMIYLVAAFDLARRSRFSLSQILMMLCAGFLPVLAFVIERRVSRRVETALAEAHRSIPQPA